MKRSIFASTLACLVVSSFLTGCGGSSSGSGGTTPPSVTAPTVTSISPTSVTAGSGPLTLTVNGTGFLSSTTVQVGTVAEPTTYVSSTQVTATVSAQQMATGGQFAVIALNGAASSGSGTPVNLQINNPAPTITSLSPATLLAGTTWLQVAVTGTGFVPTTAIAVNGSARVTTYASATQVNVGLTVADVASSGTLSFTATNASPGGGTSAASTIAISNPVPGVGTPSTRTVLTNAAPPPAITITGTNYVPNTTVLLNGTARVTTYVNPTQISFQLTAADIATAQYFTISIQNPIPGGGAVDCGYLYILAATPTPVITQVSPTQIVAGSGSIGLYVYGSNLYQLVGAGRYYLTSTILWNGTPLTGTASFSVGSNPYVFVTVPANLLTTKGTATVSVSSITSTPAVSNDLAVNIIDPPPPTLTSISPSAVPVNTATTVSLSGTGFTSSSTVALNGTTISSTYGSSTSLTATIPASSLTVPGNYSLTVTTPAPGGGTTAPLNFTAYIGIANNSMIYNPINGLFYVSVPSSAGAPYGNSIVSVDPLTGAVGTPIQVGSEPNRLAITADGQYLWVALDGASAVRQVNLTTGVAGQQFSLGGNKGIYATPPTVNALAAVPGANNSVLVAANGILGIYDSGILRGTATSFSAYALAVNTTTSEVYAAGSGSYAVYTIAAGGLVQKGTASNGNYGSYSSDDLTVAGGRTYTDYGTVYDAEAGALLGTFYATGTTAAQGPVAVDTALGTAFILDNPQGYASSYGYSQIQTFNTSTYSNASASVIPVSVSSGSSSSTSPSHLTRWGANGLAFRTAVGVYSLRSNLVEDLSSVSADLGVALTQSGGATTGTQTTYTATITNAGPSPSTGVIFKAQIPATAALVSITPSSGACSTTAGIICNLGGLANAASATVTFVVMQTTAGNVVAAVQVTGPENDPASTNNQATASLAVTGSTYNLPPALIAISPAAIAMGSGDTTITLTGTGFTSASTVQLGTTALVTGFTSNTTLTATVPSAQLVSLGWAPITVSNPTPGGGTSAPLPLTTYSVITAGVNHILYDPYSRKIMASTGLGSATVAGNSIVPITPETATLGTAILIGSQPTQMALTSDGQILYTILTGSQSVARLNMLTQAADFTWAVPGVSTASGSQSLRGIATQPGTEDTIALDLGSWAGNAIYDFNPTAKTAAIRGQASGPYSGSCIQFPDAGDMLAFDTDTSGSTLDHYTVTSAGFTYYNYSQYSSSTLLHFGCFKTQGSLAFANNGGVANYSTSPATQIGYYPSISGYTYGQQIAPDTSIGAVFFLTNTSASSYSNTPDGFIAYNQATFLPQSVLPINMAAIEGNTSFSGVDLVRWGQDGLAALTSSGHIYLVRGPFVVPQLLNQNSAATLTSSSASTITHGAGNTMLTLAGSNFVPGVAVTWNGSYRTTTIADATHVTVAIPASDLAAAGSASLVATNPGAAASSALTITIN